MTETPWWKRDPAFLGACLLCAAHFSSFEIFQTPIVWDTRFYLYYASRIAHGEVPYRDFFEFKAPLSMFIGALFHRLGLLCGVEPVFVVRAGFLALAAAAGVAGFAVARRLDSGRSSTGFLALGAYLAFPFVGTLVAIGVTPKTLVSLLAPLSVLAIGERRFALAGALGTLAFFDWQVGALAAIAALAGALASPGSRFRQGAVTIAGGVGAATPFLAYFAITGALRPAFEQTIGTLLNRGEDVGRRPIEARMSSIVRTLHDAASGETWIAVAAIGGLVIFGVWLFRLRADTRFPMAMSLGIFHSGIVAFSFYDFQSYFDLYILICSAVFFAVVAIRAAIDLGERHLREPFRARLGPGVAVLVLLAARPAWFGDRPDLEPPTVAAGATLADQKEVLLQVQRLTAGRRVVYYWASELLYLAEQRNLVPFVYWDSVAWDYFKQPNDTYLKTRNRMFREKGAEVLIGDRMLPPEEGDSMISSANGRYSVVVRPLREDPSKMSR